jgi:hypothetical protein
MAASGQPSVRLNVNVSDQLLMRKRSTRALNNAQNNQFFYRGTGGATNLVGNLSMSIFNPVWRVTIGGVQYQTAILANLTITSGRTNIYEQAQAGYTNLEIINLDQSNVAIGKSMTQSQSNCKIRQRHLCQSLVGRLLRSALRWPRWAALDYAQRINIIALGALARLPKALTDGVLSDDFDGDQIFTILSEVLFAQWQAVPAALTWATYDPTTQWQDAENTGLGEIDRPGNYELENRTSDRTDVYSLVSALATSGLGYIVRKCTRSNLLC